MIHLNTFNSQEYTQSGGVRPFGVSLLIAGWDAKECAENEGRPFLFQCDPSGAYFAWKAGFCFMHHPMSVPF